MKCQRHFAALALLCISVACGQTRPAADPVITIEARGQTELVAQTGDAADDPAIWVHPTDPAKSLVLGTNKQGGLNVYDLDGRQLQIASSGSMPNNVDVLYSVPLGGQKIDIAIAGCRGSQKLGMKFWKIDPEQRQLNDITAGDLIPVVNGQEPYGSCVYHSAKDGKFYFFINDKTGRVEQYEIRDAGDGKLTGKLVRTNKVPTQVEGCVADFELGLLYVAEEDVGIWKFPAEPDAGDKGKLITRVGEHGLTADVEGLTIYYALNGKGYLIASSQGSSTFKIYDRTGDNAFVATIDTKDAAIDSVSETDGIAVLSCPLGPKYPKGLFVVQDGATPAGRQNFKLYGWEDIAGTRLLIDTAWSVRQGRSQ